MATGYGLQGFDGPALQAARGLPLPGGKTSTALARAALMAVPRLAAASGHPIRGVLGVPAAGDAGSSSRAPLAIGLAAAALLVAAALLILRRRTVTHASS